MLPLTGLKIGCIGGGKMAHAFLTGLIKSGLKPANLCASDVDKDRLSCLRESLGIDTFSNNCSLVSSVDIVILSVKPQVIGRVMVEINRYLHKHTLISIAAGIPIKYIEGFLEKPVPVLRVMPNTPCLVGESASAICSGIHARQEDIERAKAIFSVVGKVVEVPEGLMDAVTGLSGSGPAYMFLILEALADAGVRMGLSEDVALLLSAQTMLGAAKMVMDTGKHPAMLKGMVTTPAGTTIEGLFTLEEGSLRYTLMKAVSRATQRSSEISARLK